MDSVPNSADLQLGILIAKADQSLASINRVADDMKELTQRLRETETGLSTRITNVETRVTVLESGEGFRKSRLALYVSLASVAGTVIAALKAFGVL